MEKKPDEGVPVPVAQGEYRVCTSCNVSVHRKNWARHCHTYHGSGHSEDTSGMSTSNTNDEFLKVVEECTRSCHYMACLGAPARALSHMIGQKIPSLNESSRNMFVKIVQTQIEIFRQEMFVAKPFTVSDHPASAETEFPELSDVDMQMEDLSASTRAVSQEKEDKGRDIPLDQLRERYSTKKSSSTVPPSSAAGGQDRHRGDAPVEFSPRIVPPPSATGGQDRRAESVPPGTLSTYTRRPYSRDERSYHYQPYHHHSRGSERSRQQQRPDQSPEVLSMLKQLMDKFSR